MSKPIEDQLRTMFAAVDAQQTAIDIDAITANRGQPGQPLDLVIDNETEEIRVLDTNRNGTERRNRGLALAAAALLVVVGFVALQARSDDDSAPIDIAPTTPPTTALETTTSTPVAAAFRVSLIVPETLDPFDASIVAELESRSATEDFDLIVSPVPVGDAAGASAAVQAAVDDGAGAVLVAGLGDASADALLPASDAGIVSLALGSTTQQSDAIDLVIGFDDYTAGQQVGAWAGGAADGDVQIALLEIGAPGESSIDTRRVQGFLNGFGVLWPCGVVRGCGAENIDPSGALAADDASEYTSFTISGSYEIVCREATGGTTEGGREAMARCLADHPNLDVVYSANEAIGSGAIEALDAAGRAPAVDADGSPVDPVLIASVGGSCSGVFQWFGDLGGGAQRLVASTQLYPGRIAEEAVNAIGSLATDGTLPAPSPGFDYISTGELVVTDSAGRLDLGINTVSSERGSEDCWG